MRNFGMSNRPVHGGRIQAGPRNGTSTRADLNLLPLRHPLKQLAIDVSAILFGVMLACVAATAVGVSVYILYVALVGLPA